MQGFHSSKCQFRCDFVCKKIMKRVGVEVNLWKDRMAPRQKGRLPRCRRGHRIDARSLWRGRRWNPGWTCDLQAQAPCGSEWGPCCCPRRCPLTLGFQTETWLASQGHFKHANIMVKTLCSFFGHNDVLSNNLSFYLYKKVTKKYNMYEVSKLLGNVLLTLLDFCWRSWTELGKWLNFVHQSQCPSRR